MASVKHNVRKKLTYYSIPIFVDTQNKRFKVDRTYKDKIIW